MSNSNTCKINLMSQINISLTTLVKRWVVWASSPSPNYRDFSLEIYLFYEKESCRESRRRRPHKKSSEEEEEEEDDIPKVEFAFRSTCYSRRSCHRCRRRRDRLTERIFPFPSLDPSLDWLWVYFSLQFFLRNMRFDSPLIEFGSLILDRFSDLIDGFGLNFWVSLIQRLNFESNFFDVSLIRLRKGRQRRMFHQTSEKRKNGKKLQKCGV